MTAKEYAALLIAESKKPKSERTFTIANVPVKMRGEVGYWLRKEYGGNESDKKLGEIVNKVAFAIPGLAALPATVSAATTLVTNPVSQNFIIQGILGYLGGQVMDEATRELSNNRYSTFGDYVYNASGLSNLTKNTIFEDPTRFVSEMTNPGYYVSAAAKPVYNIYYTINNNIKPGPTLLKYRNVRQNVNDGVKDLINYTKTDRATEPKFFKFARSNGNKQLVRNTPAYVTENGILIDFPDQPIYKNSTNTAAISKLDDHTYSLRLSPEKGQTLSLADRKQVLNWVNDLPHHSYISGDYSTLPQGQVFTNMLKEGDFGAFIKNYIWPSKGPILNTSGMSPDAYEYVAKLAKRPGYGLRYTPEPMNAFNSLGAHGKNKVVYDGWVSSLTSDLTAKKKYVDSTLNPWLKDLGVEQLAYLDMRGNVVIPHISAYKYLCGGKIKKAE